MNPISILKYVFSFVGLILLVGAFYCYINTQAFIKKSNVALGKVVEFKISRSNDGDTYRPVVLFITHDGKQIIFTSSVASSPAICNLGAIIEVLYDPTEPKKAEINRFISLWLSSLILGILGVIFFFIVFFIFYLDFKRRK